MALLGHSLMLIKNDMLWELVLESNFFPDNSKFYVQ